jgi:hypothetical protein
MHPGNGHSQRVVFQYFIAPPKKPHITAIKLEKLCRNDVLGYVIQVNDIQEEQGSHETREIMTK